MKGAALSEPSVVDPYQIRSLCQIKFNPSWRNGVNDVDKHPLSIRLAPFTAAFCAKWSFNLLKPKIIALLLTQSILIQACGGLQKSSYISSFLGGPQADEPVAPLDTDGDGLSDYRDPCPTEAASGAGNNGCVSSDMDGDGVYSPVDECPDSTPGEEVFKINGCNKYIYFGTADLWGTAPNALGVLEEMMAFSIFGAGNSESLCKKSTLELAQPYIDQGLTVRGGVRCEPVEN